MRQVESVAVGELMAVKTGSVDPSKCPGEAFDLYSIPAFDRGAPEVTTGPEIGSSKQLVGDVIEMSVQDNTSVWVRFHDGLESVVQFLPRALRGVFACLHNPAAFRMARIKDGVLTWPGELDLAPDAMHEAIAAQGKWVLD